MKVNDTVTLVEDTGRTGRTITGVIVNVEDTYVEIERGGVIDTVFYEDITDFRTLGLKPVYNTIRPSKIGVPGLT